jgi:riboflavin transporter FmnP
MDYVFVRRKSVFIAGTALLGAMVVVLDWGFRIAGLKIPYPLDPQLRFDLMGIPIILSMFLFGLASGIITCTVAFTSIALRGPPNAFLKFLAELSTLLGVYLYIKIKGSDALNNSKTKIYATITGIVTRVPIMAAANILLLPLFFPATQTLTLAIISSPATALFNISQGAISAFGGFLVYEAVTQRLPQLRHE